METISKSNISTSTTSIGINIEDEIKKRNQRMEKIVRSELLSNYYDELLNETTPYAPHKFRTKVLKNTPERDLKHRRKQTIDTVKVEINIMQDRIHDWREKVTNLDADIEKFLSEHEDSRNTITNRIRKHQEDFTDNYSKTNLAKLKEEYEKDKATNFEFLLKIVDDANNRDTSKNYRGRSSRSWYRGRNNR